MTMNIFTIYKNNAVDLVYRAAKTCVRGELKSDFELRKKTIMNSVGMGHESLLEHTNLILCFQLSKTELIKNFTDYIDFVETLKYLNFRTYEVTDDKIILVLGGSIRGYKHIFRNIKHQENTFLQAVKGELYGNCIKEFFMDFVKDGIMDEELFSSYTVGDRQSLVVMRGDVEIVDSENLHKGKIEILSYDSLYNIQERILTVTDYVVPFVDLLNFATISIKFSDISRTASHQIVRHRAAISQESQRYVNYDFANFINPIEEKIKARDTIYENRKSGSDKVILNAFDGTTLDYIDVQIKCKVSDSVASEEKLTNIAEVTGATDSDGAVIPDRDSEVDNVTLPSDETLPNYKDEEINRGDEYIPGNEDDDDFEKVVIEKFDLALRKFITGVNEEEITNRYPVFNNNNGEKFYVS